MHIISCFFLILCDSCHHCVAHHEYQHPLGYNGHKGHHCHHCHHGQPLSDETRIFIKTETEIFLELWGQHGQSIWSLVNMIVMVTRVIMVTKVIKVNLVIKLIVVNMSIMAIMVYIVIMVNIVIMIITSMGMSSRKAIPSL